jgi:hypothetical protein
MKATRSPLVPCDLWDKQLLVACIYGKNLCPILRGCKIQLFANLQNLKLASFIQFLTNRFNIRRSNIIIIIHLFIDDTTRGQFDNTVTNGLNELTVV